MNILARTEKTIAVVPIVLVPVQVQVAITSVVPQIRDVPVAVLPNRTICAIRHPRHCPLNTLGAVSNSESKIPQRIAPSLFIFSDRPQP